MEWFSLCCHSRKTACQSQLAICINVKRTSSTAKTRESLDWLYCGRPDNISKCFRKFFPLIGE